MIYCINGHQIDDTNDSYGGIICGICGETFETEPDFETDPPEDEDDRHLDVFVDPNSTLVRPTSRR